MTVDFTSTCQQVCLPDSPVCCSAGCGTGGGTHQPTTPQHPIPHTSPPGSNPDIYAAHSHCHCHNLCLLGLPATHSTCPDNLSPACCPGSSHPVLLSALLSACSCQPPVCPSRGTIPTILAKFTTAAVAGEFVDFNELLHAIDVDSGEEPALCIQVAEGQYLTLPKKPKKSGPSLQSRVG